MPHPIASGNIVDLGAGDRKGGNSGKMASPLPLSPDCSFGMYW